MDEYVAFMGSPSRVIRLEWRKMRRTESKDWTSHSWLEVQTLDGKRVRMETFSNTGYNEAVCDEVAAPLGTLYEGRVATFKDFPESGRLTLIGLRDIARRVAASKPYSLCEFNCHHFVLEVWNSIVSEKKQVVHYPDRAKVGLLWGLEGTVGTWLEGMRSSLGAPETEEQTPSSGAGRGRVFEATPRESANFDLEERLRFFEEALDSGLVYLLEAGGSLVATGVPPRSLGPSCAENWASAYFPGLKSIGIRLAERMGPKDLQQLALQLFDPRADEGDAGSASPLGFLGSFNSTASTPSSRARSTSVAQQPVDVCFIALRGRETRLVAYAVLQSPVGILNGEAPQSSCLRMLSGDALKGREASFTYSLCDLPEGASAVLAQDLVAEELPNLKLALKTGDYDTFLGGWRKIGQRARSTSGKW